MKIIFDNEEQKDKILKCLAQVACPSRVGLIDSDRDEDDVCLAYGCDECWANCGIEVEVVGNEDHI